MISDERLKKLMKHAEHVRDLANKLINEASDELGEAYNFNKKSIIEDLERFEDKTTGV